MPAFDPYAPGGVSRRLRLFMPVLAAVLIFSTVASSRAFGANQGRESGLVVQPMSAGLLEVTVSQASVRELLARIAVHTSEPIAIRFAGDRKIDLRLHKVSPGKAIERIALAAGLRVSRTGDAIVLTDPSEPVLNLDVKNADVRAVFDAVKSQCGIANMMIDREVSGEGTFLFRDVPCSEGIRIILSSLGLDAETYPNVLHVREP